MTLLLIALLPWCGALLLALLPAQARRAAAWLAGAVALAVLALAVSQAGALAGGAVQRWSQPWLPALGLGFDLRLDGLALLFVLLVAGIGALVVLYAAWYLEDDEPAPRFFSFLLLFMGAMLGLVLAGNLVLIAVFWELTSLASFLLIGWWHRRDDAREGALMALAVTGAGGLCLLAGLLLLGHIAGSYQLDAVLAAGERIRAHPQYGTALALVLLGAFTKSAQFPFHFWLPHAMAAPTPVSAYLHSATMVKAGVFLLARLHPALAGSEAWFWAVTLAGLATLVVGAWIAIFQHDLKGLLAYSTISHLGLVTLLLGLDEPLAVVAAVFHIVNHATFKAGLFMAAGIIDHACGTRDMRRINGLFRPMPVTAALGMVAAAAMAGVPLLNGFLSKEMFFAETLGRHGAMGWLLPVGAVLAGICSVAYSLRFVHDVFFNGKPHDLPHEPHEPPFFMRLPVALLAVLCVAVGVAPQATVGPLLALAAQATLQAPPPAYTLALWHGLNLPLAMSAIAVAGGVALYFGLQRRVNLHRVDTPPGVAGSGRGLFQALQAGALAAAAALSRMGLPAALPRQMAWLLAATLAAGAWPLLGGPPLPSPDAWAGVDGAALLVFAIGIAATVATVVCHRRRFTALLMVGAVGLTVCLAFGWWSAPDLALTQLLVEVATVILMMLALRALPDASPPAPARASHALIAIGAGLGMAALAWWALAQPLDSVSPFYLAQTLPQGGGANAVNVVIVDFRGFDTLGEITVMGIAALVVHQVLAGLRGPAPQPEPLMLVVTARALLPFAVMISVYLYLRGHNLPGGGFVAGLVLAVALFMRRLAEGRAGGDTRGAIGWGLAVAAATGLASWLFGAPFLTSTYDYPWLPGVGGVPLASAGAFDLGVWIVVAAATLAILMAFWRLEGSTK